MSIGNLSKRKGGFGAGYLYNFKGSVNSPAGLPAAPDYGDIYKIISTDKMVIWDGNAWSDLSDLRGEKGDKGDKGDTGEPFQDLGLIEEENLSFILDWLFQDGLYQYRVPGDGGTKTTYVIVNGNDTQGGGCRQTFIESDGNIKFRICPYKEEVWREFVPYVTGEDLEEKLSEKADRQTAGGGFVGGLDAVSEDSAVSIGKGAKSKNGGFAAGLNAEANAGAGVGMSAKAYNYGGAVGRNAVAGKGFSGGDGALAAQRTHGADRVNCIQLGEGVNDVEGSLQVYGFQLMDGNGKIPEERLPELEKHFVLRGTVSDLDSLPDSKNVGDVYIVESERQFSKPCAQVVGGMELFEEHGTTGEFELSSGFVTAYSDYVLAYENMEDAYEAYLYNPDGSFWGAMYRGVAVAKPLNGLNGYSARPGTDSSFRFYVCKERGLKMNGGLYVWNSLCWDRISPEFFLEDLEKKADADSVYTKTETDALVSGKLAVKGEVNTFSDLPESAGEGDIYCLKTGGIFSNSAHSELLVGSFDEYFDDIYGDGSVYNFQNGIDNHPELSEYFTNPDSPVAYIYTASHEYLCDTTYNQPGGYSKDFYAPIMTGDNTVAFYISPAQTTFYTVGDLGLVFYHNGKWFPVSDAGWIKREFVPYVTGEDLEEKLSEKADRQTESGGFQAGAATTVGNTGATEGGAIGKNAKETNGGFAGGAGANASYGGVIGKRAAEKNGGGAAGLDTYANAGGAVGSGAVAGSGFSGGKGAKAAPIDASKGTYIDAVQLGTGTNEVPGSLQVYEFQLMDGSGKIPVERLPEAATNSNWGGVVSSWAGLPSTPKLGMYCYVSADIISGVKYIGKVSDMFITETQTGGLYVSTFKFTPPDECINPNETTDTYIDIYDTNGIKVGSLVWNATMLPSFMDASVLGASSFDDTVTFYLGIYRENGYPSQIEQFYSGSMIFWNGTKWCGVASADSVGDIETALDGILSIQNALIGGGSE